MSTRSRTWLKVAAIISIMSCVFMLTASVFVYFNIMNAGELFAKAFRKMMRTMSDGDVYFYKITLIVDMVLSIIVNIVAATTYFKLSNRTYPSISEYSTLSIVAAIQLVFGSTFIPGIIVIIVVIRNRHIYNTTPANNETPTITLTQRVNELNKLRDAGQIDNDTYKKQLDKLLTEHVKNSKDS